MAHPSSSHMLSVPSDKAGMPASPCFVHSHLDPTLSAASRSLTRREPSRSRALHVPNGQPFSPTLSPKTPRANPAARQSATDTAPDPDDGASGSEDQDGDRDGDDDDDDEEEPESITRQLAETATSVRAMSKQLARTRIKSAIQSVLIITKARDNHLIRLTRELVVWLLMSQAELQVPQPNGNGSHSRKPLLQPARPLVVYVDQQLRHSSRFDRASMERDHPDWFRPLASRHPFQRRFSRSNSISSNSSLHSDRSRRSSASTDASETSPDNGQLRYWTPEMCAKSPELFDLVITLGGDGTVLFASWLFQRVVPPIISFALGSLGFLTNFDYAHNQRVLTDAMRHGVRVNLRMRFSCTVYRAAAGPARRRAVRSGRTGEIFMNLLGRSGWEALENGSELVAAGRRMARRAGTKEDKQVVCFSTHPVESFEVLNELVVDRGPSPYVSLLELFGDDHHMTTVQADGLTVSTPTGSTAYSLSAGGSLVHPEIPAMLITPICPHTLSFRPMLLPDTMELRICVPYTSRSTAWASFDGRGRVELRQGDHIKVTASAYPFPTVCADNQSTDWFQAISRTLKWNERERQKSFVVVEEPAQKPHTPPRPQTDTTGEAEAEGEHEDEEEEDEEEDEDEDDEVFDIDDLSSATPIVVPGVPPRINTSFLAPDHRGERAGATPTRRSSGESSLGVETGPVPQVRSIIDHSKVVSGNGNAGVKTFTVWGADSCSSSSEGSGSEC